MTKKRRPKLGPETTEWKLHDELAEALNQHDFVQVWAGGTTPNQVRVQIRISDWDRWLSLVKTIRLVERAQSANPWRLHICQEFVLRPGTDDLVATWHFVVKAQDNVSAVKRISDRIRGFVGRAGTRKGTARRRTIPQGEGVRDSAGVVSYPLAGQPPDRNVPINGRGAVRTSAGAVK